VGFSPPQQTTKTELSPAQQSYQNTASNFLQGQVGQNAAPYPGQLTAPLSPQQAQAIGTQGALGQQGAGTEATGLNTLANTAGGQYLFDPNMSRMLGAETAFAENEFSRALPYATAPFQEAGQTGFSSPAQQYLGSQAAQFSTGLAQQEAQQQQAAYQQERDRQEQAAGQGVTFGMGAGQQGLQALAQPQQTQQAALTANLQEYLRQIQNPWAAALGLPNLAGMPQGATSTQTGGGSIFSMLGPLAQIASLFF
jgi:hypothetical protein